MLQIQYVRSLLRKETVENSKERCYPESRSNNFNDFVAEVVIDDKQTQTGNSLIQTYSFDSPIFDLQSKGIKSSTALKATASVQTEGENIIDSVFEKSKFTKLGSQPHYHPKLDDVPFLLGASSSASHSVIANCQNIFAMMKSHNKALCGPKPRIQQRSNSNQSKEDTVGSMIKELSDDLTNLNMRHKKLKDKFDYAQKKDSFLQGRSIVPVNPSFLSHTEEKDKKHNQQGSQQKFIIPNVRTASSKPSLSTRRKLLRSLQDFKTHLSEEDITWN
ncbi:centrosomal protein of 57 kDa-like [Uloborus diversus]|uniref:centrosomal protein of 57 kDa-like n=1 Tax=Uloborus diversus TaxID=327109 RepID=UPI00240A15EE|nr:centrosomal protein of 57 kDa-like [Uloborus diversus]